MSGGVFRLPPQPIAATNDELTHRDTFSIASNGTFVVFSVSENGFWVRRVAVPSFRLVWESQFTAFQPTDVVVSNDSASVYVAT